MDFDLIFSAAANDHFFAGRRIPSRGHDAPHGSLTQGQGTGRVHVAVDDAHRVWSCDQ
jgi:hypothetical protein